ncbi:hypothetical protein GUITHDRAFT_111196 [Guillardia theta CCMP2712]|uniref:Dynamin GTPase n=1 Tax=Guillardia theta (strain CCMP2712) TaxID=905079 RepID=L1J2V3_GUITC|nr:hypothetical protein GUITHDRAFT_111196 [Guillardia theta CCMP2712]EKX42826.1 hypothetical protein GUITHDRAFT_111196 [Guillardia theta CCMP2712]|eukprot:XP_005829806.1 hypothetical protein GUITHDRAFT_111196 [Guillardia theta CCMP2712]
MLDDLHAVMNKLHEAFAPLKIPPIDLPQIAVVGSQSSGKSSVLESIVGYDFLPRGSGICTRRPLIIQLTCCDVQDYAEFSHLEGRITDFEKVREVIDKETDKVAGKQKGVSEVPLILKFFGRNFPNLSLVDLPGLTMVPVADQPANIGQLIREMVMGFISRPNCIILAVSAANQDIANSDALHTARMVDPDGLRTLGVLTKVDLMDEGTDARDILMGKMYPLRLGYIPVVNRSQKDINDKKPMQESLKAEQLFFENHPVYRNSKFEKGIPMLSKRLSSVLEAHIRTQLPEISKKIKSMLRETQEDLVRYGVRGPSTPFECRSTVMKAIQEFCEKFREAMNGESRRNTYKGLFGPARIREIFRNEFPQEVASLDASYLSDKEIQMARRNAVGLHADLFVPNSAFETLIKRLIDMLHDPTSTCVQKVSDEIDTLFHQTISDCKFLSRFAELKQTISLECRSLLNVKTTAAAEFARNLVEMEKSYVNTEHPNFINYRDTVYKQTHMNALPAQTQPPSQTTTYHSGRTEKENVSQQQSAAEHCSAYIGREWQDVELKLDGQELRLIPKSNPHGTQTVPLLGSNISVRELWDGGQQISIRYQSSKGWVLHSTDEMQLKISDGQSASRWVMMFKPDWLGCLPESSGGRGGRASAKISPSGGSDVSESGILRQLLQQYFELVKRSTTDSIPKALMLKLVQSFETNLYPHLMQAIDLDNDEVVADLTKESLEIVRRRQEVDRLEGALRKAILVLREL